MKKTWWCIISWKNIGKKVGEAQKLGQSGQKCEKFRKIGKKFVLYAFWPKKIQKNYKMWVS